MHVTQIKHFIHSFIHYQTQDEFQQLYLAQARSPADVPTSGIRHVPLRDAVYGDSIDWREKGYVTAVSSHTNVIALALSITYAKRCIN